MSLELLTRCPEDLEFRVKRGYWLCRVQDKNTCIDALAVVSEESSTTCISLKRLKGECRGPFAALVFGQLDPETVGFIAAISRALALRGIPILVYSGFERDYVLVPEDMLGKAIEALEEAGCSYSGEA